MDLDASKHNSRRRKQTIFVGFIISISMYFRLLQNRNIFLGCEIFKVFFLGVHDIDLYMCLMLFNLFIYLF